jgi:hypothetical protein
MKNSDVETEQYDALSICATCGGPTGINTKKLMMALLIKLGPEAQNMMGIEVDCSCCTNKKGTNEQ